MGILGRIDFHGVDSNRTPFFCYMGPQCVKQNFAEALVRNALMAGRAGLNGGVEMISDL